MEAATIVKRIRALNGITRKELAELAGLAPSTVGRIEQGTLDPTWGTLSKILSSTGYAISGESIVSTGDTSAVAAARWVLERELGPVESSGATTHARPGVEDPREQWLSRWIRTGWIAETARPDNLVTMAIAAGNAAKITRRAVPRRSVAPAGGWTSLAKRLGEENIDYAVTGLNATREDPGVAGGSAVIYVRNPADVAERLALEDAAAGSGVLLIAPVGPELDDAKEDGGIRYVSPAQALLDAFAGVGREPDKAEGTLQRMLASRARPRTQGSTPLSSRRSSPRVGP